jgi:ethanolamine utilization protein EutQ (cupin superfamily)
MEPFPGVFVSSASTEEWEADPDVPGTEMHELVHADGVWSGFTRITSADEPLPWTPERREVALVLEGSVRIEIADGAALELGVGVLFSLPPGIETTWHVTTPFKEMWVLASD